MTRISKVCPECGSDEVVMRIEIGWDNQHQTWIPSPEQIAEHGALARRTFVCLNCDFETNDEDRVTKAPKTYRASIEVKRIFEFEFEALNEDEALDLAEQWLDEHSYEHDARYSHDEEPEIDEVVEVSNG